MKVTRRIGCSFALLALMAAPAAASSLYSNLFLFGDSLSDSGNNAIALAPNVTPVPITELVPTFPYASGTYSNGQVWAQSFAAALGLSADPLLAGGTNHAFGGARVGPLSPNPLPAGLLSPFPPTLQTQSAYFLAQHGNVAPSDALYVLAGGGDTARDGLEAILGCGADVLCAAGVISSTASAYAADIASMVEDLRLAGAQHLIVWNTPDVGVAPAVTALGGAMVGSLLASSMNAALMNVIGGIPGVTTFDIFGLVDDVVANPGNYGLTNVTDPCAVSVACDPSTYLFYDGVHPTSAGHLLIGEAMFAVAIPEPEMFMLFGVGFGIVALRRWGRAGPQSASKS